MVSQKVTQKSSLPTCFLGCMGIAQEVYLALGVRVVLKETRFRIIDEGDQEGPFALSFP